MKISKSKKLVTLYKKDLAASKFEALLILGFIIVGNLFLYYKAKTSWPSDVSLAFSMLILGFVPLSTFFRAFSFIRGEWKDNTVYFMMSLPTTGNTIFLSKLLALLTQFLILGVVALIPTITFVLMKSEFQEIWTITQIAMQNANSVQQIIWEVVKIGIGLFLAFGMTIIIAFFSAVVGKLFKKFSGLITFLVFILVSSASSSLLTRANEFIYRNTIRPHLEERTLAGNMTLSWQVIPNQIFAVSMVLTILLSVALFLITTNIYDRRVEL